MISWSTYAPRRARDVEAWLRAKEIKSMDDLTRELTALRIDPVTFPQDVADAYLLTLCSNADAEPCVGMASDAQVEQSAICDAPAKDADPVRRARRSSTPT